MDTTIPPLASIGIDIGKEVFHVVGFSTDGKIAFRRKIKRLALVETFVSPAPALPFAVKLVLGLALEGAFLALALHPVSNVPSEADR